MDGVWPGLVVIGEPLTFGTLGRDAALGIAELTGPVIPGCVDDGTVPILGALVIPAAGAVSASTAMLYP